MEARWRGTMNRSANSTQMDLVLGRPCIPLAGLSSGADLALPSDRSRSATTVHQKPKSQEVSLESIGEGSIRGCPSA